MARQVFFDPFGSYTEGFDRGAARQTQTEGAVRNARAQDFDFNNLAPFRLAAAQREDQLGKATLPYQIQLAPYALDTARANRYDTLMRQAKDFAPLFNTTAPLEQLAYQYFGITPGTVDTGDGNPNTQLFMQGRDGNPVPVSQVPNLGQHILDTLNWNRELQSRQLQNQQMYQRELLQNRADYNQFYGLGAQGRLYSGLGRLYGANGTQPVTGGSLFGGSALPDPFSVQQGAQGTQNQDLGEYNLGGQ